MSRWIPLYATSPSGKTLFVCLMCGRISPTPDKVCAVPPVTPAWKMSASCAVLEEIEEATGGRDNSINERIMVSVLSDGSAVAQWKSSDKKPNRAAVEIVQHVSAAPIKSGPTGMRGHQTGTSITALWPMVMMKIIAKSVVGVAQIGIDFNDNDK